MRWWVRFIITFVVMALVTGFVDSIARLVAMCPSDQMLLSAVIEIPIPILFFLLYFHLPTFLGQPRPMMASESPGHSRRWLSAWWWKWALLCLSSCLVALWEIGREVRAWSLPPAAFRQPGFPSSLSPEFRDFLVMWSNPLLRIAAMVLGWYAIYLFWRDWKQPKHEPGKNCIECGYDLTGNLSGVCPECGGKI